ncbi:hypothetical protein CI238_05771 [Colletotrichum incanum]|uniref:Uncharacterized protein n=1 Tax=Colletotrichum incanum TaxID=1573173 RepID=A0A161Y8D4_COLIC|nr:hypothetical protein CI238_05771 [Colletotrichum incanum]
MTNDELSEMQRVAITAFVLAGRSYREAARAFNCSLGATSKRQAKKTLKGMKTEPGSAKANYQQFYRDLSGQWKDRVWIMKTPAVTPYAAVLRQRFARDSLPKVERE